MRCSSSSARRLTCFSAGGATAAAEPGTACAVGASKGTTMSRRPRAFPILPALAATLTAGAGLFALLRYRRQPPVGHASALVERETAPDNFDQTRSACPGGHRAPAPRPCDPPHQVSHTTFPRHTPTPTLTKRTTQAHPPH